MLEGGNEQCITNYDTNLQAVAESVAANCSIQGVRDQVSQYGLAFFFKLLPDERPTMEEFVEEIYTGVNSYDYAASSCVDEIPCHSFLAFSWFENSRVGCALSTCKTVTGAEDENSEQYFGVCAYNHKADLTARPYVSPPECQFCPNEANVCTNHLCCKYIVKKENCFNITASNLKNLYRVHHTSANTVLTTNDTEVEKLIQAGATSVGIIGRIATGNDSSCSVLKPVHHIYSPHFKSNYYIADDYLFKVRMNEGYVNKGIIGYAVQGVHSCSATIAIYDFFRYTDGITHIQNSTEVQNYMSYKSGYLFHGVSFAIWN
ncbi:CAP domain containing protein [Trichuris trichiura]|uniref:CAP domain containing protein n=1 Tax=Trichuris trichiura TaxID=36087 RepID=A0A077Z3A0_TRITR|nr:CAP domain containing protein [Trichuris trichiura]